MVNTLTVAKTRREAINHWLEKPKHKEYNYFRITSDANGEGIWRVIEGKIQIRDEWVELERLHSPVAAHRKPFYFVRKFIIRMETNAINI